jgi:hypothetical protein
MLRRVLIVAVLLLTAAGSLARGQVADLIGGYAFGKDTKGVIGCVQAFGPDSYGSTYTRADFGFREYPFSLKVAYLEFARSFMFWPKTDFKDISLHAEFNGFLNMDNCNWLFGLDYTLPTKDLFRISLLYKTFNGNTGSNLPLQLTFMWDMKDLFGISGLEFRGVVKGWGEEISYWYNESDPKNLPTANFALKATPQLWYSVGQFFGWDGLSAGGELELTVNYFGYYGFRARAFTGLRFSF